jgi:hypothetical protein
MNIRIASAACSMSVAVLVIACSSTPPASPPDSSSSDVVSTGDVPVSSPPSTGDAPVASPPSTGDAPVTPDAPTTGGAPNVPTQGPCANKIKISCEAGQQDGCDTGLTTLHVCVPQKEKAGPPCEQEIAKVCDPGFVDACLASPPPATKHVCVKTAPK